MGDTGMRQRGKAERDPATMGKGCLQRSLLQPKEHVPALLYVQGIWELRSKHPGQEAMQQSKRVSAEASGWMGERRGTWQELCGTCTAMWVPLAVASNATC